MRRTIATITAAVAAVLGAGAAAADRIALAGVMGEQALIVIDGRTHRLGVGGSAANVRLVRLGSDSAVVEHDGRRTELSLGGLPVNLGGAPSPGTGSTIVLSVGSGGHYRGSASINGRPVRFMVDTGASAVALSQSLADQIGLRYRDAPRAWARTANGPVAVHLVRLQQVRIGEVLVREVEAVVVPAPMDEVLLGNSFLARFDLRRDASTLTLVKRP